MSSYSLFFMGVVQQYVLIVDKNHQLKHKLINKQVPIITPKSFWTRYHPLPFAITWNLRWLKCAGDGEKMASLKLFIAPPSYFFIPRSGIVKLAIHL